MLTGSDLAVKLAPGYVPKPGDPFTIIDVSTDNTANRDIDGQFANAPDGSTRSFDGVPFLVSYLQDPDNPGHVTSVRLTAESFTVAVDGGTSNPSIYGQIVQFDAALADPKDSSVVPTGSVQFYDGDPSSGGKKIGAAQPLDARGKASVSTTRLFAQASPHEIYAVYMATGDTPSSVSTTQDPASELINAAQLTIIAQANTKEYDGTTSATATPTFQVAGLAPDTLFGGDTLTGLSENYDNSNAGTGKTLLVSTGYKLNDGNGGYNYAVTLIANTSGVIIAPPTTLMTVKTLIKRVKGKSERVIVLYFSAALDMTDAQALTVYSLVTVPPAKKKSKMVTLRQASYDPVHFAVTLYTRKPLVLSPPLQLTITDAQLLDALDRPVERTGAPIRGKGISVSLV